MLGWQMATAGEACRAAFKMSWGFQRGEIRLGVDLWAALMVRNFPAAGKGKLPLASRRHSPLLSQQKAMGCPLTGCP